MSTLPPDIVDLDEYAENIVMGVYADPGVGKTALAGSARTLILATEKGTLSAGRIYGKKTGAQVWPARSQKAIDKALDWLESQGEDLKDDFDWIAIDTGTKMQQVMMRDIVDERVADPGAKSDNPDKVQLDEYGMTQQRFKRYVERFNDLPVNVLWLMHPKREEDEDGETFVCPDVHGKGYQLSTWFSAEMYALGYMTLEEKALNGKTVTVRQIRWKGTKHIRAKDRFDCLPGLTYNKTLPQLEKIILDANEDEPPAAPKKAPARKPAPAAK